MGKQETEQFINDRVSVPTLMLLKNYLGQGVESRTFMLREHETLLKQLWNGEGRYASYTDEARIFVESGFYMELLERICFLIEDYTIIMQGLWGDLLEFPKIILNPRAPDNVLKQFDCSKWETLLRYRPLEEFQLPLAEHELIAKLRAQTITFLGRFNDLLRYFVDYYWISFTKHKHGNTFLLGCPQVRTGGERGVLIPLVYNTKDLSKTKGVLVTPTIYEKWKVLTNALIVVIRDIIGRAVLYAESAGAMFCVLQTYGGDLSPGELEQITRIEKKCHSMIERVPVNSTLEISIDERAHQRVRELIKKFEDLFPPPPIGQIG